MDELDAALKFSIVVEGGKKLEQVSNYEEVRKQKLVHIWGIANRLGRSRMPSRESYSS